MKSILTKLTVLALLFGVSLNLEAIFGLKSRTEQVKKSKEDMINLLDEVEKKAFIRKHESPTSLLSSPEFDYAKSNYNAWFDYMKELATYAKDQKLDNDYNALNAISETLINTRKILWNKYKGKIYSKDLDQVRAIMAPTVNFGKQLNVIKESSDPVIQKTASKLDRVLTGLKLDAELIWVEDPTYTGW